MVKNEKRIKLLLLLFLGVFVIVIALVTSKLPYLEEFVKPAQDTLKESEEKSLILSSVDLEMNIGNVENVRVGRDGVDITEEAEWYSDDSEIVSVSNSSSDKGQLVAHKEGETEIHVLYGQEHETLLVIVHAVPMSISCKPFIAGKSIKVGEGINWIVLYNDDAYGVPNYNYEWTGDDGLKSEASLPFITYQTPGIKKAHVKITDMVGTVAEADCSVEIIE